jgi:FKBP-type peptidyl-prolyl cis-trans isomerase FkpA
VLAVAFGCDRAMPTAPDQGNVAYSTTDITVGAGMEAAAGKAVTVRYVGWLYSDSAPDHKGSQFDASTFSFVVGENTVIKGLEMAVTGMKNGGMRRAIIPPSLAYGTAGNLAAKIPANATLVFEISLMDVR